MVCCTMTEQYLVVQDICLLNIYIMIHDCHNQNCVLFDYATICVVITILYCTPSFYARSKVLINVMPSKSLNLIGSIFPAHLVLLLTCASKVIILNQGGWYQYWPHQDHKGTRRTSFEQRSLSCGIVTLVAAVGSRFQSGIPLSRLQDQDQASRVQDQDYKPRSSSRSSQASKASPSKPKQARNWGKLGWLMKKGFPF